MVHKLAASLQCVSKVETSAAAREKAGTCLVDDHDCLGVAGVDEGRVIKVSGQRPVQGVIVHACCPVAAVGRRIRPVYRWRPWGAIIHKHRTHALLHRGSISKIILQVQISNPSKSSCTWRVKTPLTTATEVTGEAEFNVQNQTELVK